MVTTIVLLGPSPLVLLVQVGEILLQKVCRSMLPVAQP